jgi:pentose-5-phosphate-3-epimerase
MKIDIPAKFLPKLFFNEKLINETDKTILSMHLMSNNIEGFISYLNALGFKIGTEENKLSLHCEDVTINIDITKVLSKIQNLKEPGCKSIW